MGSTDNGDVTALHQKLVDQLKHNGDIHTSDIEAAFRAVPRHLFLPGIELDKVYANQGIITKRENSLPISSSSEPGLMATMLEQLDLKPGQRVLEIGTGTGYNTALLAHIVGDSGAVITVDIDQDLVEKARGHLKAAGFEQVQVICTDGGLGYPEAAPYDRIILTVGAWDIAPAWQQQLKPDGRLVLPLWTRGAENTVAFEPVDDYLQSVSLSHCNFMRLRGAYAGPEALVRFGPEAALTLVIDDQSQVDPATIYQLLLQPGQDLPTGIEVISRETWQGLALWLALREPGYLVLIAEDQLAESGIVPYLQGSFGKVRASRGLLGKNSMCLLMRPPDHSPPPQKPAGDVPLFELFVRTFGPDEGLAQQLIDQVTAWDAAGRPALDRLTIKAYPADVDYLPASNEVIVPKRWTQLVIGWQ